MKGRELRHLSVQQANPEHRNKFPCSYSRATHSVEKIIMKTNLVSILTSRKHR